MISLKEVIIEATKNDRVCPMPEQWNRLYKLLPNRRIKGSGWELPVPLILASWHGHSIPFKGITHERTFGVGCVPWGYRRSL